jgi:hypothetical protein
MISEPQRNLKDFADDFRVTPAAIYLITSSDLFKAHLAQRRADLQERIDGGISQALSGIALKSIETVGKIIETKGEAIGITAAVDVMDKTLGRLGYGPKADRGPSVAVQVNGNHASTQVVIPVSPQDLDDARRALRLQESQRRIPLEIPPAEGGSYRQKIPKVEEVLSGEALPPLSEE